MSGWVVAWDVAAEPFRWGNAGEGLTAIAIVTSGAAAVVALQRRRRAVRAAVFSAAILVATFFVWRTVEHRREHLACKGASRHEEGRVVEGRVRNLRPLTSVWQQPRYDVFELGREQIRVPLIAEGCGYHLPQIQGGFIREAMRVRLRIWNGQILRVEIDRDDALHEPLVR